MIERSAIVQALTKARDVAARGLRESAVARRVRVLSGEFGALPPCVKAQCVAIAAAVGLVVVVLGVSQLPTAQRPVLPLASGIFLALCCIALAAPFRE